MISLTIKKFCKEDVSLIENYDKAINDDTQTWDCHHRLETELGLSQKELIDKNLYFNRPANELIFLTHDEHSRLHRLNRREETIERQSNAHKRWHKEHPEAIKGENNPNYKKSPKNRMSKEGYKKWINSRRNSTIGKNNPMYGKNPEDFMTPEAIEQKRCRMSQTRIGSRWMYKDGVYTTVMKDDIDTYLSNEWIFKCKPRKNMTKT